MQSSYTPPSVFDERAQDDLSYYRIVVNEFFECQFSGRRHKLRMGLEALVDIGNLARKKEAKRELKPDFVHLEAFAYYTLKKIFELKALELVYEGRPNPTPSGKNMHLNDYQARNEAKVSKIEVNGSKVSVKDVFDDVVRGVKSINRNLLLHEILNAFYANPTAEYDPAWADKEVEFLKKHGFEVPKKEPEAQGPESLEQRAAEPAGGQTPVTAVNAAAQ